MLNGRYQEKQEGRHDDYNCALELQLSLLSSVHFGPLFVRACSQLLSKFYAFTRPSELPVALVKLFQDCKMNAAINARVENCDMAILISQKVRYLPFYNLKTGFTHYIPISTPGSESKAASEL